MKYLIVLLSAICIPLMAQDEFLTKFGTQGKVKDTLTLSSTSTLLEFSVYNDMIYGLASNGFNRLGMVSYDLEGNANTSFGNKGKKEISYTSFTSPHMAMADNGDIYLVTCSSTVFEVVKLNIEGNLMLSFGNSGKLTLFGNGGQIAGAAVRGNTLIIGSSQGVTINVLHVDLTAEALDTTFGTNGRATIAYVNDLPYMYGMDVDAHKNTYLFGCIDYFATGNIGVVAKFSSNDVDLNFGVDGVANSGAEFNYNDGKVVGSKIYAAGNRNVSPPYLQGIITTFNLNGTIDTDFGDNGTVEVGNSNTAENFQSIIVLENGDLLAAGNTKEYMTYDEDAYYLKVSASGSRTDFGDEGIFIDRTPGMFETVYAMAEVNGYDIISGGFSEGKYFLSYLYEESATPEFPQAFSPNDDGSNDFLLIRNIYAATENTLTVYDREGNRVFQQENYENNWKGLNNNEKPLSDGVYYYVFSYKSKKIKNFLEIRR